MRVTVHNLTVRKALNTIFRGDEEGVLSDADRDELKPLVIFHLENREEGMTGQPIHLAPDVVTYFEIEFFGGSLDGKVIFGDTPEFDAHKARWLLRVVAPFIGKSEEEGRKLASYMTWRQSIPEMVALAAKRGWSQEEQTSKMLHHMYHVTDYVFTDSPIRLKS